MSPPPEKIKPTSNVPPPPDDEETTGQHVRVKLEELDVKLDEAIKVDRDDHKRMTDTMQGITRVQNQHYGELSLLRSTVQGLAATVAGVDGKVDGMTQTIDAIHLAVEISAQQNHRVAEIKVAEKKRDLEVQAAKDKAETEVQAAKDKADTDNKVDKVKSRRGLGYRTLQVLIGLAGLLMGHLLHSC